MAVTIRSPVSLMIDPLNLRYKLITLLKINHVIRWFYFTCYMDLTEEDYKVIMNNVHIEVIG